MKANEGERQSCGNCGNNQFSIYRWNRDFMATLFIVECLECKSTTIIRSKPADLQTDWGDDSEGILCTFPKDAKP